VTTGINTAELVGHVAHVEAGAATINVVVATGRCSGANAVSVGAAGANPAVQVVGAKPAVQAVGAKPAVTTVGDVAGTNVGATATVVTGCVRPHRRKRQRSNSPMRGATTTGAGAAMTGANATVGVTQVAHCAAARGAVAPAHATQPAAASAAARTDNWVMFALVKKEFEEVIPLTRFTLPPAPLATI
jgi:hypothetical protein